MSKVTIKEPHEQATEATAPEPTPKKPAKYLVHAQKIVGCISVVNVICTIALIKLCQPGFWGTLLFAILGLPAGLAFSYLYYQRKRAKTNIQRMLNVRPGVKGLKHLVSCLPTWVSLSDTEKAEWMNNILLEMWPFYDAAVCDTIKEQVGPIMDSIKPPLIMKRIGFQKLQFGDAPIRIEGVRMDRGRKDCVALEIDFRWAGDANIVLAIEPAVGGSATRMCPKITDIRCVGTIGVTLVPLVDEIPGFASILVTLMRPPKLSYRVNLGAALGGGISGGAVKAFVDGLIPDILEGFLVWPQRIVVPILGEEYTGPLDRLMLRHKGILKVQVLEAKDIPKMDQWGSSDPFVEIFTDPKRKHRTSKKKNTLNPVWGDDEPPLYLMVQEPDTQLLRWEMFDVDMVNAKQMLKGLNVIKNLKESIHNESSMSKGELKLRDVSRQEPGKAIEKWYWLGSDDWSADDGPGRDCGEVKLRLTYFPLSRLNPEVADFGTLIVRAKKGTMFPRMIDGVENSCSPYFTVKVGNEKLTSLIRYNTTEPDWTGTSVELYRVANEELCKVKFYHKQSLSDEVIGLVTFEIADVQKSKEIEGRPGTKVIGRKEHDARVKRGETDKEFEGIDLEEADSGKIIIECRFVPHF